MTDSTGHLDLDALADVLAGERDDDHLRSCRPCTDRLAELAAADASVTAALASLPPLALPAGLAGRLGRALQEERRGELAAVRPLRRRTPTWLPAVAASAALVMAGAVGWSLLDLSGGQSSDTAASSAGGGLDERAAPEAATPGAAAPEAPVPAAPTPAAAAPEAATGLAAPRAGTATDWADEASRPAALSRLLVAADPPASAAAAVPTGDGLDRLRDPAALAACLAALPGGDEDVLAVDYARYAGTPAVVVVQDAGPGTVTVTVVGSGCSAGDPEVLSGSSLPRP